MHQATRLEGVKMLRSGLASAAGRSPRNMNARTRTRAGMGNRFIATKLSVAACQRQAWAKERTHDRNIQTEEPSIKNSVMLRFAGYFADPPPAEFFASDRRNANRFITPSGVNPSSKPSG